MDHSKKCYPRWSCLAQDRWPDISFVIKVSSHWSDPVRPVVQVWAGCMRRTLKLKQVSVCVHLCKCRLPKKCQILLHSSSTAPVTLRAWSGCCVAGKCCIGPTNCFRYCGLVRILYKHPLLRFEGGCLAQCQGFLQGDSFAEGRNYLQV